MRIRILPIAGVLVMAASLAQAQTTTADGVAAFVRGDYQRAAEILKPIAEKSPLPDYAAKLLMGTLYENGLGIVADRTRACVLYMLAADPRHPTPFAAVAETLLRAMRESMTREEFEDCELLASLGFDHNFQPVTFVLETGHWISWDLKGATITYGGKETRIARPMGGGYGTVFLPLQHTELMVGPSRSMRRHFIEVSMWVPARDRQTWTLTWRLLEVVRNELIGIASENPVTISAQEPPTAPPFDVHAMARVRVNDIGNAEWAVLTGPNQKSRVIETDAERHEQNEQKRAREAADARVDWTRVRDVKRTPALTYSDGDGCRNVFLFGWSDDRTEAIAVRADRNLLQLSTTPRTFDVALQKTDLEVVVHVYERAHRSWPFCTDVGGLEDPVETWRAVSGTVTIELSPPGMRALQPSLYRATIRIVGAELVSATGVRVKQVRPITLTAIVGWVSG